ncbi:MAG: SBBP repeat-containing protein [Bacteroidia bacterium]
MQSAGLPYLLLICQSILTVHLFCSSLLAQPQAISPHFTFEENKGQWDSQQRFLCQDAQRQVRFLDDRISVALVREVLAAPDPSLKGELRDRTKPWNLEPHLDRQALVWNMVFEGAAAVAPEGAQPHPGAIHYLRADLPPAHDVRRYQSIWYRDLYPGIDLHYYGNESQQLKYDFLLDAGATIDAIRIRLDGVKMLEVAESGRLLITTDWGEVFEERPYAYQERDKAIDPVSVQYRQIDAHTFGFEITGAYDPSRPLVIDPVTLNWATYLHSSTSDDYAIATRRDASGAIYVVGYTQTATFPLTPGIYQSSYGGGIDNYVAKMSASGSVLLWSTYLGGSSWEQPYGIGLTAGLEPIITGFTNSTDYPVTGSSFQPVRGGGLVEGFVSKLSADGKSLSYSSYLGGTDRDYPYDLQVAPTGEAYITGFTFSTNYPVTAGAYQTSPGGNGDAFVTQVSADGSSLVYSTFFGGNGYEIANALQIDATGAVYIGGCTNSTNMPVTADAYQTSPDYISGFTQEDAFVMRLSADGSSLVYATYLGGKDSDVVHALDLGGDGDVYLAGSTASEDFPTTGGALQPLPSSNIQMGDVFVMRLDSAGVVYSTYLGGSNGEIIEAICVSAAGEAYVLGSTMSGDFPTTSESNAYAGMYDIFLSILNAAGNSLQYSLLYGGSYNDYPRAPGALQLDGNRMTLGLTTHSPNAQVTTGAYQTVKLNGANDAPWLLSLEIGVVLPLRVQTFEALWDEGRRAVVLDWTLETEVHEVVVERSTDHVDWSQVAKMSGVSQAGRVADTWQWVAGQVYYYRLRLTDSDGRIDYGPERAIHVPALQQTHILLYPQPASTFVQVGFLSDAWYRLRVVDIAGRVQWSWQDERPLRQVQIPVAAWPAGVYVLQAGSERGYHAVKRLVVIPR